MTVLDMFSLHGRVAVVTGGAGSLGKQMVEALSEAGAAVIMASRDLAKLQRQVELFREAKLDVAALSFDQSDEGSIIFLLDQVLERAGRVDILVNNAANWPMKGWSAPAADFAQSMQTNLTGAFMMTRSFGEYMAAQGGGSIINIGSAFGVVAPDFSLWDGKPGGLPDYFVHKGGLLQLTRYAAAKLGPRGVRVNMLSPGLFHKNQDAAFVGRASARTFLGRMGSDTDLKGAVVFLASDASSYVSGANLMVDGGYTAQ